jgi:hypothetical protein
VAQAGLWDVDGNGLAKIEDANVARAILKKVNDMNTETVVKVAVPATLFALLPQSASAPLVAVAATFAALYFSQGKIPEA